MGTRSTSGTGSSSQWGDEPSSARRWARGTSRGPSILCLREELWCSASLRGLQEFDQRERLIHWSPVTTSEIEGSTKKCV